MSREYVYTFRVICASEGKKPNLARVEEMIDLSMQDLVYDDNFIEALDEDQSVTIQVTANFGQQTG
jgi:hypothetical protein